MCIDLHQTGSVGEGSNHLQLIKFWPSCVPGKGVCDGVKIFGSALLLPHSVCVSPSAFSFNSVLSKMWVLAQFIWLRFSSAPIFKKQGIAQIFCGCRAALIMLLTSSACWSKPVPVSTLRTLRCGPLCMLRLPAATWHSAATSVNSQSLFRFSSFHCLKSACIQFFGTVD